MTPAPCTRRRSGSARRAAMWTRSKKSRPRCRPWKIAWSEALAERGRDFDETMDEREEEEERLARFAPQPTKPSTFKEEKEEADASVQ